ncbi:hypothetical protein THOM_1837 [Trachipleistophora hominis]|uniref:Uncharacterized protein n=1 Tax=Trachipleistophora hominis TaxID=72359 RepID=L7JUY6_TRAHO|nr:hypothetical protein THOM_1837 [Trachipleistophora hominis]
MLQPSIITHINDKKVQSIGYIAKLKEFYVKLCMYILWLITLAYCSRKLHRYLIRPYENRGEIMKMYGNLKPRIVKSGPNASQMATNQFIAEIEEVAANFVKIKMNSLFLCTSDESNNVEGSPTYLETNCLWKVERLSKNNSNVMLKIGGNFLVKATEKDNRESSYGHKLKLVPFTTADSGKWFWEKYKPNVSKITEYGEDEYSSSSDSDDSSSELVDQKKKKSVIIGVEKKLRPEEKKMFGL